MDNLCTADKRLPATERVALALKSAGVSITVTSITNMFAFLIGATSVSICLYGMHISSNNIILKCAFLAINQIKHLYFDSLHFRACR